MTAALPDDFRCPISLEIMSDPVILPSGHTFDRGSIQRWLDDGNRTCPITKMTLPEQPSLIPNYALRSLIYNYTLGSLEKVHPYPPDPQGLIKLLLSPDARMEQKLTSLDHLNRVSKRDSAVRRRLAESGAVAVVVHCIDSGDSASGSGLQEKALHLLLNLSLDDDSKVGLVAEGIVGTVVYALRCGGGDSRAVAATVLTSLAVLDVNKVAIGSYPGAIPGLVDLLQIGNSRERKEATTALFMLCTFSDNRIRAIQCKAVAVLIEKANSGFERAVEVLGLLAKCKQARDEMVRFGGILDVLIGILRNGSSSSRGAQFSLITLSYLCCHSEKMGSEALRLGLFETCIGLLEVDNEKIRGNAKTLMEVLQGKQQYM